MLVLLPGMDGTGLLFSPFLKALPAGYTVRVISYPLDTRLSYAELEQLVLVNLPTNEPITLIAESFSGPIALRLSNNPSANIQAIVFVASFVCRPLGVLSAILARLPIRVLLRFPPPELGLRAFLLGRAASEELVAATVAAISSVQPDVLASRVTAALTSRNTSGPLSRPLRVIAIFSTRDRLLGRAARGSLEHAFPVLETHWIEAPHLAMQTSPDKIVTILYQARILGAEGPS